MIGPRAHPRSEPGSNSLELAPGPIPAATLTITGISNLGANLTVAALDIENFPIGVENAGGSTAVQGSRLSCNGAGVRDAAGPVTIEGSTLTDNTMAAVTVSGGSTTVRSGTLSGNAVGVTVPGDVSTSATLSMTNTTVSGNTLDGIKLTSGSANVRNSTVAGNGGFGLRNDVPVTLFGTILSRNAGGSCSAIVAGSGQTMIAVAGTTPQSAPGHHQLRSASGCGDPGPPTTCSIRLPRRYSRTSASQPTRSPQR